MRDVEDHTLIVLLVAVSLAFAWILWPFSSAILWATVLAIVFAPLYRRLRTSMVGRQNFAAIATVLIIVTMVILPLTFTAGSLLQEATNLYETIEAGQTDFGQFIQQVINALPTWATDLLNCLGLTDLGEMQRRLSAALVQGSKTIATQALSIGKGTANFVVSLFVMLYLLFFFLRDGAGVGEAHQGRDSASRRAEARALHQVHSRHPRHVQGHAAGGRPARRAWRVDLLVPGDLRSGVVGRGDGVVRVAAGGRSRNRLGADRDLFPGDGRNLGGNCPYCFGAFVIGLVDNLLRPFLVGKDTELPDYLVLISTLGGIAIFGLNGFVIGPVIAAMFIAVWDIFSEQANEDGGASR